MSNRLKLLARSYAASLREYVQDKQEAVLERAYELGRAAIKGGLGVLDIARIHQESLKKVFPPPPEAGANVFEAAETFLCESLSPFEATHRGFHEMNVNLEARNRQLEHEIRRRKKMEVAVRRSEKHYRGLFNEAQTMQENLRHLSDKILRTQEEERKRISRELHDEVGQSLTAISVTLATLANGGAAPEKFAAAQMLLQETMEKVHHFARDLRPSMLDELGLLPALRSYLKTYAARTGLHVRLRGDPNAEKLEDDQKTVLYRTAQESLTNVFKHAKANKVEVILRCHKDAVCMEVADNGVSFELDPMTTAKSKGRLGLLGMHERIRLVNGEFSVKAKPGKGTTIRVVIPFSHPPAPESSPARTIALTTKNSIDRWQTQCLPQTPQP